jgi:hypothetical protein
VTRGRRPTTGVKERAWRERHRKLLARDAGRLPPISDLRDLPPEWQQLFADMRELPRIKLSMTKARDRETWGWIYHLLVCQGLGMGAALVSCGITRDPNFDLRTCRLGTNPSKYPVGKPSKLLRYLTATVIQRYPLHDGEAETDRARRLYDAIRLWKRRDRLTG